MPKKRRVGISRRIVEHLARASSPLEPITVRLECGHTTLGSSTRQRAWCLQCKKADGLRQEQARLRQRLQRLRLQPGAECIYVATDRKRRPRSERVTGYRELSVQVIDVTERSRTKVLAFTALKVCCDARGIDYVRAKLLEMAAELDGAVIVT